MNTVLSRLGLFAIVTITLLGLSLGSNAADLSLKQQILMPGPLISGHADIEADCESCHAPFSKGALSERCLDCHEDIAKDRNTQRGFHGMAPAATSSACEVCHTDHEGRDADITGMLRESFQHQHTNFPLEGAHSMHSCDRCHQQNKPWRGTSTECVACHKEDDPHQGKLGDECHQCHEVTRWTQQLPFDHNQTDFALHGAHTNVSCSACHIAQQFTFADQSCVSCHRANDVHAGGNGDDCASCHNEVSWQKVQFDHNTTQFPLKGRHNDLPCLACHSEGQAAEDAPTTCQGCHSSDDIHLGRNGNECQQCHDETRWHKVSFSHAQDTDFPLTGKHKSLTCEQCHSGALSDPLPRDCGSCHRADDVHNNPEMSLCGTCHSTQSWQAIAQFDHDISHFPLIGMHRIVPCQHCHVGNQFNFNDQSCVACHKQDDSHQSSLGENCAQCHTPNTWNVWRFDHSAQTDFALTGKHEGLECAACHKPNSKPKDTPELCGSCHRQQDIHNGEFGKNCERCHNTNHFFELSIE